MKKEICIKCKNENAIWHEPLDEIFWVHRSIIVCPSGHSQSIKEDPPKGCPYALEHMVLLQDEE